LPGVQYTPALASQSNAPNTNVTDAAFGVDIGA
jgi:hypothetical protein